MQWSKASVRLVLGCVAAIGAVVIEPRAFSQGATVRVSVDSTGLQGTSGAQLGEWFTGYRLVSPMSADGRFIAFISSGLAPNDTNTMGDAYVHDRRTGETSLVSVASSGVQGNGEARTAVISADGRCVAFESFATNLGYVDVGNDIDIFVRDRQTGLTSRVSVSSAGVEANDHCTDACISGDGSWVGFESDATNLVVGDTNGCHDVFVHDRQTAQTSRVSVGLGGVEANFASQMPSISTDGRYLAFTSRATNLVVGDTNGHWDIFVRDRQTNTTVLATVDSFGNPANSGTTDAAICANGRWVVFRTHATNLIAFDLNGADDVFVHDLQTGITLRASVDSGGLEANQDSYWPAISADGRFVSFTSWANNLVPNDTNQAKDVFVHDCIIGQTERVSIHASGAQARSSSAQSGISANGRFVAFTGGALVAGDTNGWYDVFVRDRASQCPPISSYCEAKLNSLGCAPAIGSSGLPTASGYDAFFLTATEVLNNRQGLFFWSLAPSATPLWGGTLCVAPPWVRTPVQSSGGNLGASDCSGAYSFHFGQAYTQALGLAPGTNVFVQCWSRDPSFAPPQAVGLSDALHFTICQ